MDKKCVFLSVLGQTPQVLTEAVWGLCINKKQPIHSVEVVTTQSGLEILEKSGFFDLDRCPFKRMYDDYGFKNKGLPLPEFGRSNVHVPGAMRSKDLSDTQENAVMEKEIASHLRRLTSDGNVQLFASLAGGRKTMSAYMILGMTMYARPGDQLFHVLFDGPGGSAQPGWWYPEKGNKTQVKWANLFIVPFPRLRDMLVRRNPQLLKLSPVEVFTRSGEWMPGNGPDLVVQLSNKDLRVTLNGKPLRIMRSRLSWLALMAYRKYRFSQKHCAKVPECASCEEMFCALRIGGEKDQYELSGEDTEFLARARGWEVQAVNRSASYWASFVTRLHEDLGREVPQHLAYLDSLRDKGRGAMKRMQAIALDKSKVSVLGLKG